MDVTIRPESAMATYRRVIASTAQRAGIDTNARLLAKVAESAGSVGCEP